MHSIKLASFLLLLILVSGCIAQPGPSVHRAANTRLLEQQLTAQNKQLQQLSVRLEQLATTVSTNQAELVVVHSDIKQLQAQDTRPQYAGSNATTEQQRQIADNITPDTQQPTATQIYLKAFSAYTSDDYPLAITNFAIFIRDYPRNPYVPNAYYWLGEAYLAHGELQPALEAFSTVPTEYATARKAPDALLKLADIYAQRNQKAQAIAALIQLKQQYPDSTANKTVPTALLESISQQ